MVKGFADYKLIVTQILKFALGSIENIMVKEENTGYQYFLLFPRWSLKVWIFWYHTVICFNNPEKEALLKQREKRRKCWCLAFSPFPFIFLPSQNQVSNFLLVKDRPFKDAEKESFVYRV